MEMNEEKIVMRVNEILEILTEKSLDINASDKVNMSTSLTILMNVTSKMLSSILLYNIMHKKLSSDEDIKNFIQNYLTQTAEFTAQILEDVAISNASTSTMQ
jgi:hypothetical protein